MDFNISYYKDIIKRLNKIGVLISKEKDVDKLLEFILEESMTLTSSDAGSIYIREEIEGRDLLVFKHSINRSKEINYIGKTIPVDKSSASGEAALKGDIVLIDNVDTSTTTINKSFDESSNYVTQNMLVVPMKNEQDKVVGIFQILNKVNIIDNTIIPYTPEDHDIVSSLASQCAILIDRIKLQKKLERNVSLTRNTMIRFFNSMKNAMSVIGEDILKEQAEFKELASVDELTGLLSRKEGLSFLKKQLDYAALSNIKMVIGFVDINNLKYVNDTFGHHEGDRMIKTVVDLITSVYRDGDFMFRYGGDEFILVVNNADLEASSRMMVRIDKMFDKFNQTSTLKYPVVASFGFAEFNYDDHKSLEELITLADERMYIDKQRRKSLIK